MPRPQLFVLVASADSASLLELAADGIDDAAAVVARRVVEVPASSATSSAWLGESDTGLTFVTTTESFDTDGHWVQWQGPCQLAADDDAAGPADPEHVRQAIELSALAGPTQTETVLVECPAASVPMLLDACIAADITVTVVQEGRDPTEVKFQPSHRPRLESTDDGHSGGGGGGGGAGKSVFWGDNVVRLSDRAPLAARAQQLVDALSGKLRFSLWLMPAAGSKFERGATLTIQTLATSSKVPPFAPHLTLGPPFRSSQRDAVAKCRAAADQIAGHFECCPTGDVGRAVANPFRTLAVEIVKSEPLTAAYTAAAAALGEAGDLAGFAPHVCLLYGAHEPSFIDSAEKLVREDPDGGLVLTEPVRCAELAVVMCSGDDWGAWYEVRRFPL